MNTFRPEECDIPEVQPADALRVAKPKLEIRDSGINIRGIVHETNWGMRGAMQDSGLSLEGHSLVNAAYGSLLQSVEEDGDAGESLSE